MNWLTLTLADGAREQAFWSHSSPQLAKLDLLAVLLESCAPGVVVLNLLNLQALKDLQLTHYHPRLALYSWTLIALRLAQGAWILASPSSYARWRVAVTASTKAFMCQFMQPAVLHAAAARPGYYKLKWLAPDQQARPASSAARLLPPAARCWLRCAPPRALAHPAAARSAGVWRHAGACAAAVQQRAARLPPRLPEPAAPPPGGAAAGAVPLLPWR
jgi:hypothetical protein